MKKKIFLIGAFVFSGLCSFGAEPPAPEADARLNAVARLMAGLEPSSAGFENYVSTPAWKEHQKFLNQGWAHLSTDRLVPVEEWKRKELYLDSSLKTLYYPFSGPDFLNAALFFPDFETYLFYSLESPGHVPLVERLSVEDYGDLLTDIRESLQDIFQKQYFITKKMLKHLRTPVLRGNLPLILIFMARQDLEILGVENLRLTVEGKVVTSPSESLGAMAKKAARQPVAGVRVSFRKPGGPVQTLVYWSLDVSNGGLVAHPEFLTYLRSMGPGVTFMKSASYLLHGSNFSKIRSAILSTTEDLLQDDSGLPYRFFSGKEWSVSLYGTYTKSIQDFGGTIQKDLEAAYLAQNSSPLPFRFGYHWSDQHSNIQRATRRRSPPAPSKERS